MKASLLSQAIMRPTFDAPFYAAATVRVKKETAEKLAIVQVEQSGPGNLDARTRSAYNFPMTARQRCLHPVDQRRGGAMAAKTILVVEDDDATREGFGIVLKEHGYRVALVCTGQDALEYLQTHDAPDLISLDMFMPGMDGWHFLRLRKPRWLAVPVVITTALRIGSDEWAKSLGACALLEKPVEPASLLEKVQRCLTAQGTN